MEETIRRRILTPPAHGGRFSRQLSRLQPGELCLVVTDTAFNPAYARAAMDAARSLGAQVYQICLPAEGPLPEKSFGAAVREADLLVYSSTHKLHYSEQVREGLAAGLRVLMAVQPLHAMRRLKGDPEVVRRSKQGAARLARASHIRITSPAGTDLSMERGAAGALYGLAGEPGHLDFFGCGMVRVSRWRKACGTLMLNTGDRCLPGPLCASRNHHPMGASPSGRPMPFCCARRSNPSDENAWRVETAWGTDRRNGRHRPRYADPRFGRDIESNAEWREIQLEQRVCFPGRIDCGPSGNCPLTAATDGEVVIQGGEFVDEALR